MNFQTKLFDVELFVDYTPSDEIMWEDIYLSYAGKGLNGELFDTGDMDPTWEDAMFDEEHRALVEQLCREDYEAERIEYEMNRREAMEWD